MGHKSIRRALILVCALAGSIVLISDHIPADTQVHAETLPHSSEKISRNVAFASWSVGPYTVDVELFDDTTTQRPTGVVGRDEHITILSIVWWNQARERKLGGSVHLGEGQTVKHPSLNVASVQATLPIRCASDVMNCPSVVTIDLEWRGSGLLFYHDKLKNRYKSEFPSAYCERYNDSYYGVGRPATAAGSIHVDGQSIDLAKPLETFIWMSHQVTTGHGTWDECFR